MRKFSLFLLLATSAVPAMAQSGGGDDGDRQSRRSAQSERSERPESRPQRAERAERPQRQMRVERQQMVQSQQLVQSQQVEQVQRQQQQSSPGGGNERYQRLIERRGEALRRQQSAGDGLVPRQGRYRSVPDTNPQVVQQSTTSRDGRVSTRHYRDGDRRWSNHWRGDRRYDWRRYRDRNRSVFRIGFYYDPFGYSYRRYGLGSFLYPSYYQSSYWINDPWQYRLPPAYGPYRWVRYHNDALLIDTWTGEVVDVIHGFFW